MKISKLPIKIFGSCWGMQLMQFVMEVQCQNIKGREIGISFNVSIKKRQGS